MKTLTPLVNYGSDCSVWDAFDMPWQNFNAAEVGRILRRDFSLSAAQSDDAVFKSVNKAFVKKTARGYAGDYKKVSVSETTHFIGSIRDVTGGRVFPGESSAFGWLIFVDKNIMANWGHECRYVFYVNEALSFSADRIMPPMDINMEDVQ